MRQARHLLYLQHKPQRDHRLVDVAAAGSRQFLTPSAKAPAASQFAAIRRASFLVSSFLTAGRRTGLVSK